MEGKAGASHLISWSRRTSGWQLSNQRATCFSRWRIELTFQVAIFMRPRRDATTPMGSLDRKARPAAAGRLGVRVAHREVAAHQLVRVIQLRACQQVEARRIDEHLGSTALDDQ